MLLQASDEECNGYLQDWRLFWDRVFLCDSLNGEFLVPWAYRREVSHRTSTMTFICTLCW